MREETEMKKETSALKRPYQSPALIEYGSVAVLSQGALSKKQDADGSHTLKQA